jgi:hypothetical protein
MMSGSHSGSCLCGEIKYEIFGDFESFFLCHCKYCQKDTGSAHSANLFSSVATLKWSAGHDKVVVFTLPSTRHTRSFCSVCGSAVPSLQANGQLLVVPAGGLDGETATRPNAHIFVSSRACWDQDLERLHCHDELPT